MLSNDSSGYWQIVCFFSVSCFVYLLFFCLLFVDYLLFLLLFLVMQCGSRAYAEESLNINSLYFNECVRFFPHVFLLIERKQTGVKCELRAKIITALDKKIYNLLKKLSSSLRASEGGSQ